MRRLLAHAAVVIAAIAATSCATTMSVSSHVERGLDFSRYHTYDWGPADALPTGDPRLDANPFFKDHLEGAVEQQLESRGLELTRTGTPDLLIHYHANISKRMDVNRVDRAYGYCYADGCPSGVVDYEAGTLVIDIIDRATNKLIWRGWAQRRADDFFDSPDKMASSVEEAVNQMLLRLPRSL